MKEVISIRARREVLLHFQERYRTSSKKDKQKLLDSFLAATDYERKYAIRLLSKAQGVSQVSAKVKREKIYNEDVKQALVTVWHASHEICSKRLAPFLEEFVRVLESKGHLSLSCDIRDKLVKMSAATIDRLLKSEREKFQSIKRISKGRSLLKHSIKIRTFREKEELKPGFVEADLVAHCGESVEGSFLNTLVLTDIASGWTECLPLLKRGESDVLMGLKTACDLLPFSLLGLDTDNGGEFINYTLFKFCQEQNIVFTRSRPYRKNDQAHVEEKNGSIVRKMIGYDRYEGLEAWQVLAELYAVLRIYVNFFQPSLKLLSKKREGSHVTKRYDQASTPYERLRASPTFNETRQQKLKDQYLKADPVDLLKRLKELQDTLWTYAYKPAKGESLKVMEVREINQQGDEQTQGTSLTRDYRKVRKPVNSSGKKRGRPCQEILSGIWQVVPSYLEENPHLDMVSLMKKLVHDDPERFRMKQLRNLQRQVAVWRKEHCQKFIKYQADDKLESFLGMAKRALIG